MKNTGRPSPNELLEDLTLHIDALLSAMESDKSFFALVIPYVKQLARVVRSQNTEAKKSAFSAPVKMLNAFYADHERRSVSTINTQGTVEEIKDLVT